MRKTMSIEDLKTGMKVVQRNGRVKVVMRDTPIGDFIVGDRHSPLNDYNNDLTSTFGRDYDIMKVYDLEFRYTSLRDYINGEYLLWERKEALCLCDLVDGETYDLIGENGTSLIVNVCRFDGAYKATGGTNYCFTVVGGDGFTCGRKFGFGTDNKWHITKHNG